MNDIDKRFIYEQETVVTKTTEKPATANDPEIALDPKLEKEFFLDAIDFHGHTITVKTLGTGPTSPVVVYIDDKRWEMFPGPKRALQAAKKHVKSLGKKEQNNKYSTAEKTQESKEMKNFMSYLLEGNLQGAREFTRNQLYKNAKQLIYKESKKIASKIGEVNDEIEDEIEEADDKKSANDKKTTSSDKNDKKSDYDYGSTVRRGVRVNLRST